MLGNLSGQVADLIKRWSPNKYSGEAAYQKDLAEFLREELNRGGMFGGHQSRIPVTREKKRSLIDILVDNNIGIELKYNLRSKSAIDRLMGQIGDHLANMQSVIIVLVGNTNSDKLEDLRIRVDRQNNSGGMIGGGQRVILIDKDHSNENNNSKGNNSDFFGFGI